MNNNGNNNNNHLLLFDIQMDRPIQTRKPDLVNAKKDKIRQGMSVFQSKTE